METRPKNDEIDLFELFQKLYNEKWLILGITAITTLIAIAVSFLIPKTYRAEVFFGFPTFQIINLSELSDVFKSYEKYRKFSFNTKISQIKNSPNMGKIEVEGSSPDDAKRNIELVINIINKEIFAEKLNEAKERFNRRLTYINKAIRDLNTRSNIIFDPSKLADLMTEKENIEKWLQNPQVIRPLDMIVSSKPVKPKPMLYIAVGFTAGIFLGVFVALLKEAMKSRKLK
ncbi:MAG: Wzz/FepE/Etk N-terminal domain-containing protein [Thermodesulfovibrio sp.]|uniref:Wzz/FepE/Etk N-terminal domain-containing protein n=1 Tax=unclassified Thermodesulfovibrio TaxID=2645936 RepID=UPI00083B2DF5|nr:MULTISPECIES: Wzz/FepE/Etk N-terminal domain-containing protein [unclassified Thermodesulfovibrio]MDI1471513.1 Wzz/FepE/Etk N-terminal domain-containing protein [Thermodesulfovibrio sp. 1176]MDI6715085.1 Wzz/FepE/Etk N-terminal domain-containing protein [Thermodesulfovibrio sp.]ODA43563.1 polysaccharide export protein epsB [Thermodesulfovibrio sp. N1]